MKKFVMGFVCATILFTAVSVLAVEYSIMPNPYKMLVDGVEKQIEGYNINGYSYFKLRDIGDVTDFKVDFKDEMIIIDTPKEDIMESSIGQNVQRTSDGLSVIYWDDVSGGWVSVWDIKNKIISLGISWSEYHFYDNIETYDFVRYTLSSDRKEMRDIIFADIPNKGSAVPLEFYESTLKPFLEGLKGI